MGVIGANGSGKSTLLKIIARIIRPTKGSFEVSGRVAPILEPGVGFHPEMNLRDNVVIHASIMGLSNADTKRKVGPILEFAGLERFGDARLKNLSSGMQMRLAFSVAMETDPDVYLINEGPAVGDLEFQQKCLEKFRAFQRDKESKDYTASGGGSHGRRGGRLGYQEIHRAVYGPEWFQLSEASRSAKYWEKSVPWTFKDERLSYEKRRSMRYALQDYMAGTIGFENYKSRLVLEIGSGSGIDSAEFARNGAEVVSLDFTKNATEGTRDLFRETGMPSNVVRASAPFLPFRDEKFDCVYSFGVMHHIPEVELVVSEIARILKPRADFITMFYNANSLLYAYSILFLHRNEGFSEDELIRQYGERIVGCPYSRAYTEDELKTLFSPFFDDVTTKVKFDVIDTPEQRKVKVAVPDQYKLGWHIIAKGKKRVCSSGWMTSRACES